VTSGEGPPTEVDTQLGLVPPRRSRPIDAVASGGMFGRFTILETIGAGGMGVVMAAYDPQLDRKVAIKVLRSQQKAARLLREARAMAQLSHPNVITVYDAGTIEDRVYIAMEFVDGLTLRRWLALRSHSVDEILDVMIKAGRGLAAGHAAGLVHRDFKPDNVLVGKDGRVRVIDFGLARAIDIQDEDGEVRPSTPSLALSNDTTVGSLSGTPRYMAPEQHGGTDIDARADQFAFCVALYEALYGRVPFEVQTYMELVAAVTAGKVKVPDKPALPKPVVDAVLRGLIAKPEQRFPSMDALLAQLEPPKAKKTRMIAVVGGGAALAAAAVTFAALRYGTGSTAASSPCAGGDERITSAWSRDARTKVRASLVASGRSHAAATADRVEHELDRYASDWRARRVDVCEATKVRHERSDVAFDLGMRCLGERAEEVRSLAALLGDKPDVQLADRAVAAVERLPPVSPCAAIEPGMLPAPGQVDELRRASAEVRAYYDTGNYARAVEKTKELLARARTIGYVPFEAEVELQLGQALQGAGQSAEAETALRDAVKLAALAKDDTTIARAWTLLVGVVGFQLAHYEEGIALAPVAEAAITRAEGGMAMTADLAYYVGSTHVQKGVYDLARDAYEQALALRIKLYGEDHPDVAQVHNGLGAALLRKGDLAGAAEHFKKAIAIREKVLGATHPDVALPLGNLAAVEQAQGHIDAATRDLERALKILEEVYGPDHPQVALTVHNLGEFARDRKDCTAAVAYYTRALTIFEKLGPEHPYVALPTVGRAQCYVDMGRPKDGIVDAQRAVDIFTKQGGDPAQLAEAKFALARSLWAANTDRPRALALAQEARKAFAAAGPLGVPALKEIDAWIAKPK
jgi:tetratricopeptide (TPR) repeat protein/predicted Ser/Thr protein kinase